MSAKPSDGGPQQVLTDEQTTQKQQLAEQMCMQADAHFFGFAPLADKREAMRLYEESSDACANTKAMLALGSIHEKGLVNERRERGGAASMGATEKPASEPDFQKAFEYYD